MMKRRTSFSTNTLISDDYIIFLCSSSWIWCWKSWG